MNWELRSLATLMKNQQRKSHESLYCDQIIHKNSKFPPLISKINKQNWFIGDNFDRTKKKKYLEETEYLNEIR